MSLVLAVGSTLLSTVEAVLCEDISGSEVAIASSLVVDTKASSSIFPLVADDSKPADMPADSVTAVALEGTCSEGAGLSTTPSAPLSIAVVVVFVTRTLDPDGVSRSEARLRELDVIAAVSASSSPGMDPGVDASEPPPIWLKLVLEEIGTEAVVFETVGVVSKGGFELGSFVAEPELCSFSPEVGVVAFAVEIGVSGPGVVVSRIRYVALDVGVVKFDLPPSWLDVRLSSRVPSKEVPGSGATISLLCEYEVLIEVVCASLDAPKVGSELGGPTEAVFDSISSFGLDSASGVLVPVGTPTSLKSLSVDGSSVSASAELMTVLLLFSDPVVIGVDVDHASFSNVEVSAPTSVRSGEEVSTAEVSLGCASEIKADDGVESSTSSNVEPLLFRSPPCSPILEDEPVPSGWGGLVKVPRVSELTVGALESSPSEALEGLVMDCVSAFAVVGESPGLVSSSPSGFGMMLDVESSSVNSASASVGLGLESEGLASSTVLDEPVSSVSTAVDEDADD